MPLLLLFLSVALAINIKEQGNLSVALEVKAPDDVLTFAIVSSNLVSHVSANDVCDPVVTYLTAVSGNAALSHLFIEETETLVFPPGADENFAPLRGKTAVENWWINTLLSPIAGITERFIHDTKEILDAACTKEFLLGWDQVKNRMNMNEILIEEKNEAVVVKVLDDIFKKFIALAPTTPFPTNVKFIQALLSKHATRSNPGALFSVNVWLLRWFNPKLTNLGSSPTGDAWKALKPDEQKLCKLKQQFVAFLAAVFQKVPQVQASQLTFPKPQDYADKRYWGSKGGLFSEILKMRAKVLAWLGGDDGAAGYARDVAITRTTGKDYSTLSRAIQIESLGEAEKELAKWKADDTCLPLVQPKWDTVLPAIGLLYGPPDVTDGIIKKHGIGWEKKQDAEQRVGVIRFARDSFYVTFDGDVYETWPYTEVTLTKGTKTDEHTHQPLYHWLTIESSKLVSLKYKVKWTSKDVNTGLATIQLIMDTVAVNAKRLQFWRR